MKSGDAAGELRLMRNLAQLMDRMATEPGDCPDGCYRCFLASLPRDELEDVTVTAAEYMNGQGVTGGFLRSMQN